MSVGGIFCVSVGMENRGEGGVILGVLEGGENRVECVGAIGFFRGRGEQGEGGVDIECVSGTGKQG